MKKSAEDFVVSEYMVEQMKILGKNLKRARVRRSMTQQELADRVFVSRQLIAKIEKGNPSVSLGVLANVLWCFGLQEDFSKIAYPDSDEHGKMLEERELRSRVRKRTSSDPLQRFMDGRD